MADLAQYHNTDAEGYRAGEKVRAGDEVYVSANGATPERVGDRIWLFAGEGRPKQYYLAYWFIADRAVPATPKAKARLYGKALGVGRYRTDLKQNPAFRRWYLEPQHYSHGLTQLHPELLRELQRLASRA